MAAGLTSLCHWHVRPLLGASDDRNLWRPTLASLSERGVAAEREDHGLNNLVEGEEADVVCAVLRHVKAQCVVQWTPRRRRYARPPRGVQPNRQNIQNLYKHLKQ